jgi:hypothetical protein
VLDTRTSLGPARPVSREAMCRGNASKRAVRALDFSGVHRCACPQAKRLRHAIPAGRRSPLRAARRSRLIDGISLRQLPGLGAQVRRRGHRRADRRGREAVRMLISMPTQPGSSGSPLLTMDGAVIGVVTGGTNEVDFARDSGALPQNLNWGREDGLRDPALRPARWTGQSSGDADTPRDRRARRPRRVHRAGQAVANPAKEDMAMSEAPEEQQTEPAARVRPCTSSTTTCRPTSPS